MQLQICCACFNQSVFSAAVLCDAMASGAKRRRPSGGGPPLKAIKGEGGAADLKVPVDALLKQHVRLFDHWMHHGSTSCQADLHSFLTNLKSFAFGCCQLQPEVCCVEGASILRQIFGSTARNTGTVMIKMLH